MARRLAQWKPDRPAPGRLPVLDATYTKNWPRRRPVRSHPRMMARRAARAQSNSTFLKLALSTSAEKQQRRLERAPAGVEQRTAALIAGGSVRPGPAAQSAA
jgi:hypothetical protein